MEAGTTRIVVPAFLFGEPFSRRTHLGACTPATAGTQAQLPHQHAGGGEQRAQLRTRRPNRRRYRSIRLSASTSPIRYRPARRGAFSKRDTSAARRALRHSTGRVRPIECSTLPACRVSTMQLASRSARPSRLFLTFDGVPNRK